MPARFCAQCGTPSVPGANFCMQCGARLGSAPRATRGDWQITRIGSGVLAFFLLSGLAIWTTILTPAPPRPAPGAASRSSAPAASSELPEGHPQVAPGLPREAQTFIADLAAKAKQKPDDAAAWVRLGEVYYRAAEVDPAYYGEARTAFEHVLDRDPKNAEALRGLALVRFDRSEHKEAAALYERYLALHPDDVSARTYLGASYAIGGDSARGRATLQDIIRSNPSFWLAHYYLGAVLGHDGDRGAALAELKKARDLAEDDDVRQQIDRTIASFGGETAAAPGQKPPAANGNRPSEPEGARSPFQATVEQALRDHPIMGPRIVRFEWSGPGTGRVVVQNFPMEGMPPAVRDKFTTRLAEQLRQAQTAHRVDGSVRMDIADASSGTVMATVTP